MADIVLAGNPGVVQPNPAPAIPVAAPAPPKSRAVVVTTEVNFFPQFSEGSIFGIRSPELSGDYMALLAAALDRLNETFGTARNNRDTATFSGLRTSLGVAAAAFLEMGELQVRQAGFEADNQKLTVELDILTSKRDFLTGQSSGLEKDIALLIGDLKKLNAELAALDPANKDKAAELTKKIDDGNKLLATKQQNKISVDHTLSKTNINITSVKIDMAENNKNIADIKATFSVLLKSTISIFAPLATAFRADVDTANRDDSETDEAMAQILETLDENVRQLEALNLGEVKKKDRPKDRVADLVLLIVAGLISALDSFRGLSDLPPPVSTDFPGAEPGDRVRMQI